MPDSPRAEAGTSRQKPQALEISLGTGISSTGISSALSARSARIAMWLDTKVMISEPGLVSKLHRPGRAAALADDCRLDAVVPELADRGGCPAGG